MPNTYFRLGAWKAQCDRCGFHYHNTQLRREWTGLMVCHGPGTNDCWEPRNTQEYIRGVKDQQAPPWTRPAPDAKFTTAIITGATQANPVVITTESAHKFSNGKTVYIADVNGMTEINRRRFTIANVTSTTFELSGEDGTGHGAFVADDTDPTSADQKARASVDVTASDL